jgi:hypothetical protein
VSPAERSPPGEAGTDFPDSTTGAIATPPDGTLMFND